MECDELLIFDILSSLIVEKEAFQPGPINTRFVKLTVPKVGNVPGW